MSLNLQKLSIPELRKLELRLAKEINRVRSEIDKRNHRPKDRMVIIK